MGYHFFLSYLAITTGKRNMSIYILNFLRKAEKWQFVWVIEKA